MSNAVEAYQAALREAAQNGLNYSSLPARAHAWATYWLARVGYGYPGRPDITSGYRSPSRQRILRRRWDRGDRAGLVARPACQSQHTIGNAIDVETDVAGFDAYAYLLTEYTGATDGRTFGDPGHFDWRRYTNATPPNICTA